MKLNRLKIFYLLLIMPLLSCNIKTANKDKPGYYKVDDLQMRKGKLIKADDWRCLNTVGDRVCYPFTWNIIKQNKCLFFTQLDDTNSNTFFAVVRYNTDSFNISMEDYVREVYKQLKSDSIEIFKEYTFRELKFDKKNAFYGEFLTEVDSNRYLTFTMYTDFKDHLYDLSLKIPLEKKGVYYEIFQDVLYNYMVNDTYIFSEKDELNSFSDIDLSKF